MIFNNDRRMWSCSQVDFLSFVNQVQTNNKYNLNPSHQRNVVHSDEWKCGIIQSAYYYNDIPQVYFHPRKNSHGIDVFESLDGKQRCSAILEFFQDKFVYTLHEPCSMYGKVYSELSTTDKMIINNSDIGVKVSHTTLSDEEIEEFFNIRQASKNTSIGEFLNSKLTSSIRTELLNVYKHDEVKQLFTYIKQSNKRFEHLEMLARFYYLFQNKHMNESELLDPENDTILQWWTTSSPTHIKHFKHFLIYVLEWIIAQEIKRPYAKVVYVPYFFFMLKNMSQLHVLETKLYNGQFDWPHTTGDHSACFKRYTALINAC